MAIILLVATPFIGILTKSEPIKQTQKVEQKQTEITEMGKDSPAPIKTQQTASTQATEPTPGVEQYRYLVQVYYPAKEVDNALVIMQHESGGNPNAVSQTSDVGLMQLHTPLWSNFFGVTTEQLKDPETNIRLAYQIWDRADGIVGNNGGSWKAWSTWQYLSGA